MAAALEGKTELVNQLIVAGASIDLQSEVQLLKSFSNL